MMSDAQSDIFLLNHLNELSQFLLDQKQISQPVDLSKHIEPKFIEAAQA